jgi:RNA polymerase sigma factor (sigma-70 family)
VDDRTVVAALVSGDPRGLDSAYRTYADRLFTYCRGMLRDSEAAADAVHDTFILANQRAGQLRDPERLRSWLYAIARNECLRILRRRGRQVPLDEAGQVSAPPSDPGAALNAADAQELVRAAAEGLNPGDREVLELAMRHELAAAEVGAALGVSVAHAHARLSRARAQLERALGALLVARTGRQDCITLAGLLADWDGRLTALVRKRISRHLDSCDICADRRRRQLSPAALFSAYASAPMLVAPAELFPRLRLTSADPAYAAAVDRRAGRWHADTGFPLPLEAQRRKVAVAGVAAVAVAALFAFGGGFLAAAPGPEGALGADTPGVIGSTSPGITPPTSPPAGGIPPPGPTTPTTAPPPATTPAAPPRPPQLVIEVDGRGTCDDGVLKRLVVEVTANQPLQAATLIVDTGLERRYQMEVVGSTATIDHEEPQVSLSVRAAMWWVTGVTGEGEEFATQPVAACRG